MPLITVLTQQPDIKYDNSMPDFNMIWGIVLTFAVLFGALFLARWLSKRTLNGASGSIRILERAAVSRDAYIMLLQVGARVIVVGANKEGMTPLCELTPEEYANLAPAARPRGQSGGGQSQPQPDFFRRFAHNFKIQAGILPKGTPPMTPGSGRDTERDAGPDAEQEPEDKPKESGNWWDTPDEDDAPPEQGAPAPVRVAEHAPSARAPGSFAAVLHRVQESSAREQHTEQSNPEPPSENTFETGGPGKLRINARVKSAKSLSPQAERFNSHPEQDPGASVDAPDLDGVIKSLRRLGDIDLQKQTPPPAVETPAVEAPAIETPAAVAETPVTGEPEAAEQETPSFGPPEVIIPLKPLEPRVQEQERQTVWTLNPEFGEPEEEDAAHVSFDAVADEMIEIPPMPGDETEPEDRPKPLSAREARQQAERLLTQRLQQQPENDDLEADKLDELFDRVQRRNRRYQK